MLISKKTVGDGSDIGWVSGLMGAIRSAAGQTVTPKKALSIPVLQECVSLLAESVAQLPVELYHRTSDGGREPAAEHPLMTS